MVWPALTGIVDWINDGELPVLLAVTSIMEVVELVVWPALCTCTGPLTAVAGTTTVKDVAVADVAVAETVPPLAVRKRTVLFAAVLLKPVPVMVNVPPRATDPGETEVIVKGIGGGAIGTGGNVVNIENDGSKRSAMATSGVDASVVICIVPPSAAVNAGNSS